MSKLPFKPGTPKTAILLDGWSRALHPSQVKKEVEQMGYETSHEDIVHFFTEQDKAFIAYWRQTMEEERQEAALQSALSAYVEDDNGYS